MIAGTKRSSIESCLPLIYLANEELPSLQIQSEALFDSNFDLFDSFANDDWCFCITGTTGLPPKLRTRHNWLCLVLAFVGCHVVHT